MMDADAVSNGICSWRSLSPFQSTTRRRTSSQKREVTAHDSATSTTARFDGEQVIVSRAGDESTTTLAAVASGEPDVLVVGVSARLIVESDQTIGLSHPVDDGAQISLAAVCRTDDLGHQSGWQFPGRASSGRRDDGGVFDRRREPGRRGAGVRRLGARPGDRRR